MTLERDMTRAKLLWIVSAVSLCFGTIMVAFLGNYDSHRTNARYLWWKSGHAPKDYRWCLHLFFVDSSFQDSMKGKSVSELRDWLPATGPAKPGSWQQGWLESTPPKPHETFEVIGDTSIAIRLVDGRFDGIFPMKG